MIIDPHALEVAAHVYRASLLSRIIRNCHKPRNQAS